MGTFRALVVADEVPPFQRLGVADQVPSQLPERQGYHVDKPRQNQRPIGEVSHPCHVSQIYAAAG